MSIIIYKKIIKIIMSIIEFGIILIFKKSKIGQWESLETFSFPLIIEIPLFKCQLDINMKKR